MKGKRKRVRMEREGRREIPPALELDEGQIWS